MWSRSSTVFRRGAFMAFGGAIAATTTSSPVQHHCEQPSSHHDRLLRKRTTLRQAATTSQMTLERVRRHKTELLQRWERDEMESWRKLPARAWPAVQPDPEQMKEIKELFRWAECSTESTLTLTLTTTTSECFEYAFQIATTLVFYGVDVEKGLQEFRRLAALGHVDAMVACGVILVEGLGVPPNEREGIKCLEQAANKESEQALYELGTIYYVGIDDVVGEDEQKAFQLFSKAAAQGHTAAMFMTADCLLYGEGTEQNEDAAVPLFYRAAEQGHRFARQRIRELLRANPNMKKYCTIGSTVD